MDKHFHQFKAELMQQYKNALQVHSWKCEVCAKPFLTTYRAFETVKVCPYCKSPDILHANIKGPRVIVIW